MQDYFLLVFFFFVCTVYITVCLERWSVMGMSDILTFHAAQYQSVMDLIVFFFFYDLFVAIIICIPMIMQVFNYEVMFGNMKTI